MGGAKQYYVARLISKYLRRVRHFFFLKPIGNKGRDIRIYFPVKIHGKKNISIGSNVSIGEYSHFWAGEVGLDIGNNVMIAAHCCVTTLGHDVMAANMRANLVAAKIIIEDDVWLGYNVTILPGVKIGRGSVIGAGSVVTKNVPPLSIAVGNPAKCIKTRDIKP